MGSPPLRGGCLYAVFPYYRKHFLAVDQNIVVPETEYPVPFFLEPRIAFSIVFSFIRLDVLSAVELDRQLLFKAYKINDIFSHGMLASELEAFQTFCP
jgi:hypothetical protein